MGDTADMSVLRMQWAPRAVLEELMKTDPTVSKQQPLA